MTEYTAPLPRWRPALALYQLLARYPMRVTFPIIIGAGFALLMIDTYVHEVQTNRRHAVEQMGAGVAASSREMAAKLAHALVDHHDGDVTAAFSPLSSAPDFDAAVLVDADGKVLAASDAQGIGASFDKARFGLPAGRDPAGNGELSGAHLYSVTPGASARRALGALHHAEFRIRTMEEARELGIFIANTCPESQRVVLGLTELLVNAVEHGNLELSYADKSRLMESGSLHDEIAARLADPRFAARVVAVDYLRRDSETVAITIVDEGPGFDWQHYLDFDPERAFHAHGRGIAMANKLCFDELNYRGRGNEVCVISRRAIALATGSAAIAA
ncbi:MAG: ATP-binding protein [Proteobacteria bacterium]|nr:ATP-binding protein [Pseudomonadota bacterium]